MDGSELARRIFTSQGWSVQRGYKVIVPVDCSASESVYHEQYAVFQLAKGGPVTITANVTLTRTTMVKL